MQGLRTMEARAILAREKKGMDSVTMAFYAAAITVTAFIIFGMAMVVTVTEIVKGVI